MRGFMDIAKTAAWIRRAHRKLCVETMMIMDILQFFDIVMNMIKGDF